MARQTAPIIFALNGTEMVTDWTQMVSQVGTKIPRTHVVIQRSCFYTKGPWGLVLGTRYGNSEKSIIFTCSMQRGSPEARPEGWSGATHRSEQSTVPSLLHSQEDSRNKNWRLTLDWVFLIESPCCIEEAFGVKRSFIIQLMFYVPMMYLPI